MINYLSKIERGTTERLSTNTLSKTAYALGVTIDSLMNGENVKSSEKFGPNWKQMNNVLSKTNSEQAEQLSKKNFESYKN